MHQLDIPFQIDSKFVLIFYPADSEYGLQQVALLQSHQPELANINCSFKVLEDEVDILYDLKNFKTDLPFWGILDRDGELLFYEVNPQSKNLVELGTQFLMNYNEIVPKNHAYKWGNVIPEAGDYMCTDCGYILTVADENTEYQPGDPFPVCEVCQAGTLESPTGPDTGFWEKI